MHPVLRATLKETVKFKPLLAPSTTGPAGHGPETGPVCCRRSDPTFKRRRQGQPDENIGPTVTIYLDGCDFKKDAIPVGSMVSVLGGQWQPLVSADSYYAPDGSIDHWRLKVEG